MITTHYRNLLGYFLMCINWLAYNVCTEKKLCGAGLCPTGTIWLEEHPVGNEISLNLDKNLCSCYFAIVDRATLAISRDWVIQTQTLRQRSWTKKPPITGGLSPVTSRNNNISSQSATGFPQPPEENNKIRGHLNTKASKQTKSQFCWKLAELIKALTIS